MWLVVGLGNPGLRYADTRHNFGFRALERLWNRNRRGIRKLGALFRRKPKKDRTLNARVATVSGVSGQGEAVTLLWPETFMNLSGQSVKPAMRRFDVPVERLVVCHDDVDLPLGRLKVKKGGGAGGHKGLLSIEREIGSSGFIRVRGGVGRPEPGGDVVEHVLQPFSFEERPVIEEMIETACDAVGMVLREGPVAAMNRFNRK